MQILILTNTNTDQESIQESGDQKPPRQGRRRGEVQGNLHRLRGIYIDVCGVCVYVCVCVYLPLEILKKKKF
jgi:hypothetical protein